MIKIGELDFSCQKLDDDCAQNIAQYILNNNYKSTSLFCTNNSIGDKGIIAITKKLPFAPNITHLFLSDNLIGDRGFEALLDYIVHQPSKIEYIDIFDNPIWQKSTSALSYILKNKSNMTIRYSIKAKM